MNISAKTPIFHANHLRVIAVVGDVVKVRYCLYWDTEDINASIFISDILALDGCFKAKMFSVFGFVPDMDFLSDFLMDNMEDLDYFLADDCSEFVSRGIRDNIGDVLDGMG